MPLPLAGPLSDHQKEHIMVLYAHIHSISMALNIFGKNGASIVLLVIGIMFLIMGISSIAGTDITLGFFFFIIPLTAIVLAVLNMLEKKFDLISIIAVALPIIGIILTMVMIGL